MLRHEIELKFTHRVAFTRNVFDVGNPLLADLLAEGGGGKKCRALVLIDSGIA